MATPSYELWVSAQAEALAAEKIVLAAVMAAGEGTGPPVSDKQIAHAKSLRGKATGLLNATLMEMDRLDKPGPLVEMNGGQPDAAPSPAAMLRYTKPDSHA